MQYDQATKLFSDSQSAIALTQNPIFHSGTKHVELKFHYIRQLVERGDVQLYYVSMEENPADVLMKALSKVKHEKHTAALGLRKLNEVDRNN